jgi:hypothetical protein
MGRGVSEWARGRGSVQSERAGVRAGDSDGGERERMVICLAREPGVRPRVVHSACGVALRRAGETGCFGGGRRRRRRRRRLPGAGGPPFLLRGLVAPHLCHHVWTAGCTQGSSRGRRRRGRRREEAEGEAAPRENTRTDADHPSPHLLLLFTHSPPTAARAQQHTRSYRPALSLLGPCVRARGLGSVAVGIGEKGNVCSSLRQRTTRS